MFVEKGLSRSEGARAQLVPRELLRKVRRIEIRSKRLVDQVLAGQYHSVFKGRGMEFSEVREYSYADEVRTIDWKVTARMGTPYVKLFTEERELTVVLCVDQSGSSSFGSGRQSKAEIAAEICALLAFSAIRNQDRVGFIGFTDRVETYIPPKKGRAHVLRVVRQVLYPGQSGGGTSLNAPLEFLGHVLRKRSVVFLVSDFLCPRDYLRHLRLQARHHDLIAVYLRDPHEYQLPAVGRVRVRDPETGRLIVLNTGRKRVREALAKAGEKFIREQQGLFVQSGIDCVSVSTDEPFEVPLISFFRERARRLRP